MWYSLLFVVICSCSGVLVQKLYFLVSPALSLLVTACIATAYFNLVNLNRLKATYRYCWRERKLWLAIMLIVALMWYCTMNAPGLIGAALYNFIYFTWLGALGFLFLSFSQKHGTLKHLCAGICSLFLIAILLTDFFYQHGVSLKELLGIFLSIVGGTTSFIYFKQTQALTQRTSLSASQVLATRYFLTIFLMIALLPLHHQNVPLSFTTICWLVVLAFISLIAPLYCIQKALEKISSEHNAIYVSLTPIVTALIQEVVFHDVNFHYLIVYGLYTLMMVFYGLPRRKNISLEEKKA